MRQVSGLTTQGTKKRQRAKNCVKVMSPAIRKLNLYSKIQNAC
jgi:hypothetical protein